MIVYHGSNSNFKTLKISPKLCKHESTKINEGYGIYFSTDRAVAESYGKYVYVLDINDDCFVDYRRKAPCQKLMDRIRNTILHETKLDIYSYFDHDYTVNCMYCGGLTIACVGKDIAMILDNTEEWYNNTTQTQRDKVERILRSFDKSHKAYMFTYHIQNIGVIKDVDESVVKIIRKEPAFLPESEEEQSETHSQVVSM